jgi:hypothetical protein
LFDINGQWQEIFLAVFSATTYHSLLIFGIQHRHMAHSVGFDFRSVAHPLPVYPVR